MLRGLSFSQLIVVRLLLMKQGNRSSINGVLVSSNGSFWRLFDGDSAGGGSLLMPD